jgi:hypothetical protein
MLSLFTKREKGKLRKKEKGIKQGGRRVMVGKNSPFNKIKLRSPENRL